MPNHVKKWAWQKILWIIFSSYIKHHRRRKVSWKKRYRRVRRVERFFMIIFYILKILQFSCVLDAFHSLIAQWDVIWMKVRKKTRCWIIFISFTISHFSETFLLIKISFLQNSIIQFTYVHKSEEKRVLRWINLICKRDCIERRFAQI